MLSNMEIGVTGFLILKSIILIVSLKSKLSVLKVRFKSLVSFKLTVLKKLLFIKISNMRGLF